MGPRKPRGGVAAGTGRGTLHIHAYSERRRDEKSVSNNRVVIACLQQEVQDTRSNLTTSISVPVQVSKVQWGTECANVDLLL